MSMITEKMWQDLTSNVKSLKLQTPFYLVNKNILEYNFMTLTKAFSELFRLFTIGYSYKTNYAPAICGTLHKLGAYAEVVSPIELSIAASIVNPNRIIYNGVIREDVQKYLIARSGGIVNIENFNELSAINQIAIEENTFVDVGVRLNINIDNGLHSRFGIEPTEESVQRLKEFTHLNIRGIHCHTTQGRSLACWKDKASQMAKAAKLFGAEYIDLGGNMYGSNNPHIRYLCGDNIPTFNDYAKCIHKEMSEYYTYDSMPTVIVEPGTPLVSDAVSYIVKVEDIKKVGDKNIVLTNGKRLDISVIGTSKKEFPYRVINLSAGSVNNATVCGCTCLEGDVFISDYTGDLSIGDLIAFESIGAYSNSLAPRFISAPPAMYLYEEGCYVCVKAPDDLNSFCRTYKF